MSKISPLQLAALMLCGRCVTAMTYAPTQSTNTLYLMLGILISTIIQIIAILPVLAFSRRFQSDSPCTLAASENRFLGITVSVIYLLFFMFSSFLLIGNFVYLMDFYMQDFLPRTAIVAIMIIAAFYVAKMNISVLGKSASLIFAVFIIFTVIIFFGSGFKFDFQNFYFFSENNSSHILWNEILHEFARNEMLVILVFLLPDINGSCAKASFTYFAVKLVIIELILCFVVVILGDFALVSKFPFFYLAAFSKTSIVERYDAVFMSMWIIMSLIKLGTLFHCSGKCLKIIVPKLSRLASVVISGLVPALLSLAWLIPHKWNNLAHYTEFFLPIFIVLTIIPLIMLFTKKEASDIHAQQQS